MIKSSLLKTRIRLLQCYDWKPTALCVSQNGSFQSPCSLWEQEFRSSTDIRQPSTVNSVLVSCSGVIGNSLLLVCHTERRPQSPCSMWEQELNRYPSTVNRQPCLSVSLDCSQQLIQNCIRAWSFLNDLMIQHQILETLCVFKWSKCFNRQCCHPSFDHRDISEVMQIYCSHSVQVSYTKC